VFWPRNAATTFDSPVHQKFRFKVRGCFLHEPSFYSASGEQRPCMAFEPTEGKGYAAAVIDMSGVVTGTVEFEPEEVGMTRVVLADMIVTGAAGSYYDAASFGKPQRAAVLRAVSEESGLAPHSILIEQVTQDGKDTKVLIALVTTNGKVAGLKDAVAGASAAAMSALNAMAQGGNQKTVSAVTFNNVRDMLQYSGTKKVLSSSVVLTGVDAAKVVGSTTFRDSLQSVIAAKVGVDKHAVQITSIEEHSSGRRLGGIALAGRALAGFNSVKVSFTVVTDADMDSTLSAEDIAAAMQAVTNDGSLISAVNAETALSFTEAQMVGGGIETKKVLGVDYQTAFVICLVIMILLFVVVLVLVVKVVQSPKGAPNAGSASSGGIQMQEGASN
jgi:purine-nucleoside phosphorylase